MAITLAKNYTDLLDKVYKNASVTADLTGDPAMLRAGANASEIIYPQVTVTGLGDYSRANGYTSNSIGVTWVTASYNYDRGTKIVVDSMDNQETFDIAFGMAGSELERTKVAPEADAFTFATIAGKSGISKATPATLSDASAFLAALLVATNKMDEDEVTTEGRILYATPTLVNGIMALDTTKSREVLSTFAKVVKVPQTRFYTAIDLLDGSTSGEEAGHYIKNVAAGKNINFMIIEPSAIIKHDKHVVGDLIPASANQTSDGDMLKYRKYGIVDVYNNKVAGIYMHNVA